MFAAHLRDRTERTQSITAFGDFQIGEMPRRDLQADRCPDRRESARVEIRSLLLQIARPVDQRSGDFLSAKYADQRINFRSVVQHLFFLSLRQATRYDHTPVFPLPFQVRAFRRSPQTIPAAPAR